MALNRRTTYKRLLISGSDAELKTLLLSNLQTGISGSNLVIDADGNVGIGTGGSSSGSISGSDYTEWATYTGTRAGSDLDLTIGDYDNSGNGTKINLNDAQGTVSIESTTSITGSLKVQSNNAVEDSFIIKSGSTESLKVNNEGITQFFAYENNYVPTPKLGGVYFTSSSLWVGLQ